MRRMILLTLALLFVCMAAFVSMPVESYGEPLKVTQVMQVASLDDFQGVPAIATPAHETEVLNVLSHTDNACIKAYDRTYAAVKVKSDTGNCNSMIEANATNTIRGGPAKDLILSHGQLCSSCHNTNSIKTLEPADRLII